MIFVNESEVGFMCLLEPVDQCNIGVSHVRQVRVNALSLADHVLTAIFKALLHTDGVGFSMVLDSIHVSSEYVIVLFLLAKVDLYFVGEVLRDVCCLIAILLDIVKVLDFHHLE